MKAKGVFVWLNFGASSKEFEQLHGEATRISQKVK
jgi:hypothetical protein